jgi:hypothetical protein
MSKINSEIISAIENQKALVFGKIGGVEAQHLAFYLQNKQVALLNTCSLPVQAGIYPSSREELQDWCDSYLQSIKNVDYLLQWCPEQGDEYIIETIGWDGVEKFDSFRDLEPFTHGEKGWHYHLKDKKLLTVAPFPETIKQQVPKYSSIWRGAEIGEVQVVKSPYSAALLGEAPRPYREILDEICEEIKNSDFDVATVGCGGYSLMICDFIKSLGKPSIHLGGANQILFGIKGTRWDGNDTFKNSTWYDSQDWIRPLPEETPPNTHIMGNEYW